MKTTDGQLLLRFIEQSEESAFQELMSRYGPMVMGVCRRILANTHDAEDAFQATFLVLSRKATSLTNYQSIAGWSYQVALRTSLKLRSKVIATHECKKKIEETMPPPDSNEDHEVWENLKPILDEELNRLPEKYRLPLVLCYLQGSSYEQAAEKLSLPFESLKTRLSRARELLRTRLIRRGAALSMGGLATFLSNHSSAAVSSELAHTTLSGIISINVPNATSSVAISERALSLSEGVQKALLLEKAITIILVTIVSCSLIFGSGVLFRCGNILNPPQVKEIAKERKASVESVTEHKAKEKSILSERDALFKKLDDIVINDGFDFNNKRIEKAVEILVTKSKEADPTGEGIPIRLQFPIQPSKWRLNFQYPGRISMRKAIMEVAENGKLRYKIENNAVILGDFPEVEVWTDKTDLFQGSGPIELLRMYSWMGDVERVKSLLQKNPTIDDGGKSGYSPLIQAAEHGHTEVVKLLLAAGYDPNSRTKCFDNDKMQMMPFHFVLQEAAKNGFTDTVQVLLDAGADIRAKDRSFTALKEAIVENYHTETAKLLISRGADLNDAVDALYRLVGSELPTEAQWETINFLISVFRAVGRDLNLENENGDLLLSTVRYPALVQFLVQQGCDVNAKSSRWEQTALTFASMQIDPPLELIEALLASGANPNLQGPDGRAALHYAGGISPKLSQQDANDRSSDWRPKMVRLLITKGANLEARDRWGNTPLLSMACAGFGLGKAGIPQDGREEALKILLAAGADVRARDNKDYTALIYACRAGRIDLVKTLIAAGAEINAQHNSKRTELSSAEESGNLELVQYLQSLGAKKNTQE